MGAESPLMAGPLVGGRHVFGLAGWSGSGKTTLLTQLLPALIARGVSVSTLKHAHHDFDIDQPGKDSHRHRTAGATEVLVTSDQRWALMHELRGAPEPSLEELLTHLSPVDLVIVEGFKRSALPKLEIHRPSVGKQLMAPEDKTIVAVASDVALTGLAVPCLSLERVDTIATFIIDYCALRMGGLKGTARGAAH
jgi:molybdopterin-guanine dinucleotide biosynthesis protein B